MDDFDDDFDFDEDEIMLEFIPEQAVEFQWHYDEDLEEEVLLMRVENLATEEATILHFDTENCLELLKILKDKFESLIN